MFKTKLTSQDVQKKLKDTPPLLPSFYVCPYADPNPDQATDYSLVYFPEPQYGCDINLAFINPSDDKAKGTFGNTTSDRYLCHLRDRTGVQDFIAKMQKLERRILVSLIDSPTIHWDAVNVESFVRNTEGEITADGTIFTNDLMHYYKPVGRMWDAETPTPQAMATVMKACFLRGIQRDPDNYVFIYTTYANRDIDQIILPMPIDPNGSAVDKGLYELGFRQISDFITMRGSLSWLETMSYSDGAYSRFQEADLYAVQYLAKGDISKLNAMRKFISIGVAPGLTSPADAITIAAACDPAKSGGYGRFMVWAANCPDGLSLFNSMLTARDQKFLPTYIPETKALLFMGHTPHSLNSRRSGNRSRFFALPPTTSQARSDEYEPLVVNEENNKQSGRSWINLLTCGLC